MILDFPLKNLKHLDLTGLRVYKLVEYEGEEWVLPPLLESLSIRDIDIPLHNSNLLEAIAAHKPLKKLDISLCSFSMSELETLSEGLRENLEVLNMAGENSLFCKHC